MDQGSDGGKGSIGSRGRAGRRARFIYGDGRAIGGFYEAIMALMIVTVGIVLLTTSFTLISVSDENDPAARGTCDRVMELMLNDPDVAPSTRFLDNRSLTHVDFGSMTANWSGGLKVMLTFSDAPTVTLYDSGGDAADDRACRTEPVNVLYHQGVVKAAMLTVWVWR